MQVQANIKACFNSCCSQCSASRQVDSNSTASIIYTKLRDPQVAALWTACVLASGMDHIRAPGTTHHVIVQQMFFS